jgi:hypothetical protein
MTSRVLEARRLAELLNWFSTGVDGRPWAGQFLRSLVFVLPSASLSDRPRDGCGVVALLNGHVLPHEAGESVGVDHVSCQTASFGSFDACFLEHGSYDGGAVGACDRRGSCRSSVARHSTPPPPETEVFTVVCLRRRIAPGIEVRGSASLGVTP